MTILVTGGAGFIGSHFVRDWLARQNEPLVTLDALTYAANLSNLEGVRNDSRHTFVQGDINDMSLVASLLTEYRPRAIVHLAAESHVDRSISRPEAFIHSNSSGTFHLLEATKRYWQLLHEPARSDFRFLHVSTDEVFGALGVDQPAFTEKSPYAPNSPYAASKAASDHFVRSFHHTYGLPTLTTHCSNNYGPNQYPEKLIPLTITRALAGELIPLYGDGQQRRDWLYVGDHCTALRRILEAANPGSVYTIGGNCEKTNLELVHTICTVLDRLKPRVDGKSYTQQITHVADRPGHDRRYAIDASTLKRDLGWSPTEQFEDALTRTIQWFLR